MSAIQFTEEELQFLENHRIFDLKTGIYRKINVLFSDLELELKKTIQTSSFHFPENTLIKAGKISRGENYRNQPYFVLDFPRLFRKENIFAFRTVLWWGYYLSNIFLLSGKTLEVKRDILIRNISDLHQLPYKICIHSSPWKLENDESNYLDLRDLPESKLTGLIKNHPFLKITDIYDLSDYDQLIPKSRQFLTIILDLLD